MRGGPPLASVRTGGVSVQPHDGGREADDVGAPCHPAFPVDTPVRYASYPWIAIVIQG
jgi:hypothetical protein